MTTSRVALLVVALVAAAAVAALVLPPPAAFAVTGTFAAFAAIVAWRRAPPVLGGLGTATPEGPAAHGASGPLETAFEALAAPVLLLDDLAMVIAASEGAARLFETPAAAMHGRSLIRATGDHHLLQLAREAPPEPHELTLPGGQAVRVTARQVDAGRVRVVLTLEDVTELRSAQRARTDLIGNVSHELRTPITAALALAETLEGGVPDPEQRERFRRQLTAEIARLGQIVDRLLRLSRIESADEPFHLEPLAPAGLLATAADRIAPIAGPEQRIVVEPTEAPPVLADRERVLEVMTNLLDNALRFSPPRGAVTLSATPDGREVRFEVRDEGPGILPSDRARIFERFYTGDRSRTPGPGGTGLGLAIARHIVSRHRGRIWAAPSERGAVIRFTLPVARETDLADGATA
jgi:two-component system phosphate regulon sensor histidine kinase PhoR